MTFDLSISLTTILVFVANVLLGMALYQFKDLKEFIKGTRKKLDSHIEDFALHGLERKR